MAIDFPVRRILFARIDFDDYTFCIRSRTGDAISGDLQESVARVGLLHPPIVMEKNTGALQIVAGRKRLLIARDVLGAKSCNCMLLPEATSIETVLSILIEEILISRPLTPVEKALFFQKAANALGTQRAAELFLPRLGLAPHPYHIKKLLALLELEEPILVSIDQGDLGEKVALELTELSFKDRMTLYEIILELSLSVGYQKKLLTICRELSIRTKSSIADILEDDAVRRIRLHPDANVPQKGANLMAWLTARQFPRLSEAEKKFRQFAGSLGLPEAAGLTHTLSFENDALTLSLPFKNREEFLKVWERIKQALSPAIH